MGSERSGPCRHAGSPPEAVIERVSRVIETLSDDTSFLANCGLTAEEYAGALPAAIEALRGKQNATNADRRQFLQFPK